jgi:hypothetical protein
MKALNMRQLEVVMSAIHDRANYLESVARDHRKHPMTAYSMRVAQRADLDRIILLGVMDRLIAP